MLCPGLSRACRAQNGGGPIDVRAGRCTSVRVPIRRRSVILRQSILFDMDNIYKQDMRQCMMAGGPRLRHAAGGFTRVRFLCDRWHPTLMRAHGFVV
jgi:hypothetical protein